MNTLTEALVCANIAAAEQEKREAEKVGDRARVEQLTKRLGLLEGVRARLEAGSPVEGNASGHRVVADGVFYYSTGPETPEHFKIERP